MQMSKGYIEAINIIKGLVFSQLMLQDDRAGMLSTGTFNTKKIFEIINISNNGKITPNELMNYLGVHRIASSQRQCQYLISLIGGPNTPFVTQRQFTKYINNDQNIDLAESSIFNNSYDEVLKAQNEIQFSKILERQIQFYRAIQLLRKQYHKKYGDYFKQLLHQIDQSNTGNINRQDLIHFINNSGIQFSYEQFYALCRKIHSKNHDYILFKEFIRALSPFQPLSFPVYRKQTNVHKALQYISEQVNKLQIDTHSLPYDEQEAPKRSTGFGKVIDKYRKVSRGGRTQQYFYDKNYYNELKQYKSKYYDPNKDVKTKLQNSIIGPQYHDHFFSDYYIFLEQRNKTQHYYNKFGKKYAYQHPDIK